MLRKRTQSHSTAISLGAAERARCSSMDAENLQQQAAVPVNNAPSIPGAAADVRAKLRPRTHTFSYVHHRSRGGLMNKLNSVRDQQQQQLQQQQQQSDSPSRRKKSNTSAMMPNVVRKSVHGSLTLPVYCYTCSESELTGFLLKVGKEMRPNSTLDVTFRPEEKQRGTIHVPQPSDPRPDSTESPPTLRPVEAIREAFLSSVQKAFYASFVSTVFQALQSDIPVHDFDVQHALDYCDTETILNTDMSAFLRSVCNHAKGQGAHVKSVETIKKSKSCVDIEPGHIAMRKKFSDTLLNSFQHVPAVKDLYFFRPSTSAAIRSFSKGQR